ncbi:ATPase BadF/BadG/BcrA/BcrD type [Trinorchestia longiramus]|nr:ATPase BadF/BadG/BcrA/BcrD type [Trinorchestia longiramus]
MSNVFSDLFGGVEGGGTQSTIILKDSCGRSLVQHVGPATNHYPIGIEECVRRLAELVETALQKAGLPLNTKLKGLGLCLSGCEDPETDAEVERALLRLRPGIAEHIVVGSDTLAPIATACQNGGLVVISGTGSNALLMNPDGQTYRCGGWGHMLGDEGSAYWTAARAVKLLFDEEDNLIDSPHNLDALRNLFYSHFDIKDRFGMLHHCYQKFSKSFYASMTRGIADLAAEGDPVCKQLMFDAGHALARHVAALSRNIDPILFDSPDGLPIICTGSVWNSFELLRPGFVSGLSQPCKLDKVIPKCSLFKLKTNCAVGAIYLAAKKANCEIPRDYDQNAELLFRYEHPNSKPDATAQQLVNSI